MVVYTIIIALLMCAQLPELSALGFDQHAVRAVLQLAF